MSFNEVIGQENIKANLRRLISSQHVPHAVLFSGTPGSGKLPMALALASSLLCKEENHTEPCGICSGCRMLQKLAHPDLHFVFPVIKPEGKTGKPVSDDYIRQWRELLLESPYFDRSEWLRRMKINNQQIMIYEAESDLIQQKLNIMSSQGGYKVMIIWLPETMNMAAANKLLKILEEPPQKTVFILISDEPDKLLPTILSRTQRIDFPPLSEADIAEALEARNALSHEDARDIAHISEGSYVKALQQLQWGDDREDFFNAFVSLMRLSYSRAVRDLHNWADEVASWGRERQKNFLRYGNRLVRENFIYNFHSPHMNFLSGSEATFSTRFARFINEKNVISISQTFSEAESDIEHNANARIVLFDFALKLIVLIKQGNQ